VPRPSVDRASSIEGVDFRDSRAEAAFRAELRDWLEAFLPDALRGTVGTVSVDDLEVHRDWSRALHEAGFAGLTWPLEYGGRGLAPRFQAIAYEEEVRAEAPPHVGVIGLGMAGPTIAEHGTEAQRARFLSPILSGAEIWCQGFSEPEAGSDLAAVSTTARLESDRLVVDGQKLWSSHAHVADRCLLLTRSDPSSSGRDGLTMLLLDMSSPGVDVRPLRQLTGEAEFSEIVLDGVEVPLDDALGDVGGGWDIAMITLLHERGALGLALVARLDAQLRRLVALARERGASPLQRDAVAQAWIAVQALRITGYRSLGALERTGAPGPDGAILKLRWSEANQAVTTLALELLGPDAQLLPPNAPFGGLWPVQQLRSRGNSVEMGTSEVIRSILAERVLGLPRSR
jgi:alkylation response protein AidB-like acyl-CoA dehydrogenase